ncbi:MAG: hypothetical protein ABJA67_15075 [Chthonomonadales bacterium]
MSIALIVLLLVGFIPFNSTPEFSQNSARTTPYQLLTGTTFARPKPKHPPPEKN